MTKTFEITIIDGVIHAEGQGFMGDGCDAIADLLAELGQEQERHRKADYFRGESTQHSTQRRIER